MHEEQGTTHISSPGEDAEHEALTDGADQLKSQASKNRALSKTFIVVGGILIVLALALAGYNFWQSWVAGQKSSTAVQELTSQADAYPLANSDVTSKNICRKIKPDMPEVDVDGLSYVGRLRIDALDLELPIAASYSLSVLNVAPARYAGSVYTGNIVICGHNFASHFGALSQLRQGDAVTFFDNFGLSWQYVVQSVDNVDGGDVEGMLAGSANESGWDLTLFTCTLSGQARVTVRCKSVD